MYQGARYSLALFSRVLNGRSKRKKVKSERVNVESHSGALRAPGQGSDGQSPVPQMETLARS